MSAKEFSYQMGRF